MLLFKVWKNTESINPKILKINNVKTMLLSKFVICGTSKLRFMKEAKGILSSLGLKARLSKIPLLGDILLWMQFYWQL